jgi:hypothetical protein
MAGSNQEPLRHMRRPAYRCFLPDLTGFTDSHCAGPGLQRCPWRPDPKKARPRIGFNPAIADCRLQSTANSPFSTAKLLSKLFCHNSRYFTNTRQDHGPVSKSLLTSINRPQNVTSRDILPLCIIIAKANQWRREWDLNPRDA